MYLKSITFNHIPIMEVLIQAKKKKEIHNWYVILSAPRKVKAVAKKEKKKKKRAINIPKTTSHRKQHKRIAKPGKTKQEKRKL